MPTSAKYLYLGFLLRIFIWHILTNPSDLEQLVFSFLSSFFFFFFFPPSMKLFQSDCFWILILSQLGGTEHIKDDNYWGLFRELTRIRPEGSLCTKTSVKIDKWNFMVRKTPFTGKVSVTRVFFPVENLLFKNMMR